LPYCLRIVIQIYLELHFQASPFEFHALGRVCETLFETMGKKRKVTFREDSNAMSGKRQRDDYSVRARYDSKQASSSSNARQTQRRDDMYGSVAFDDDASDVEGHESSREALDYLRSVRSEAETLPNLVHMPNAQAVGKYLADAEDTKEGAYYSDGTWIARPLNVESTYFWDNYIILYNLTNGNLEQHSTQPPDTTDALKVYAMSLLQTFRGLRDFIRRAQEQIPPKYSKLWKPYQLSRVHTKAYYEFRSSLSHEPPISTRLAATDTRIVLQLLLCASKLLKKGKPIDANLSAWIWALLARLDDVGTLNNDDVYIVRATAKTAVRIISDYSKKKGLKAKILMEMEDEAADDDEGAESEQMDETDDQELSKGVESADAPDEEAISKRHPAQDDDTSMTEDVAQSTFSGGTHAADLAAARALNEQQHSHSVGNSIDSGADEVTGSDGNAAKLVDANTRASLFMVVLVAGEVFGQTDLVGFLEEW